MQWMTRFLCDDSGQDMVEYGLLCALISIIALVTIKSIGPLVAIMYNLKYHIRTAG